MLYGVLYDILQTIRIIVYINNKQVQGENITLDGILLFTVVDIGKVVLIRKFYEEMWGVLNLRKSNLQIRENKGANLLVK